MTTLDYETVNRYWNKATSSLLGPYMMEGFGFPANAARFRFQAECKIVDRLIHSISPDGHVLDLGCGNGCWTEHFAQRFLRVVAVEGSKPLYDALEERCVPYPNVQRVHGDVMLFEPEDQFDLVFLGGMLMYLNDEDVLSLLEKLIPFLRPGAIVLCRETTVRQGTTIRQGDYQAVYRSVADYNQLFPASHLSVLTMQRNTPYVLMQMGCEFIRKWKSVVPMRFQFLSLVSRVVYWVLRLGYPWITRIPKFFGIAFPELTNHFFLLQFDTQPTASRTARDTAQKGDVGAYS